MKVVNLRQRDAAWHVWRSQGVTASDAAVLINKSPYKTVWRLWAEKVGYAVPEDLSANPNVIRGVEFEDAARRAYEDKHNELLLPVCAESSIEPIIRASLDGLDGQGRPVELKCPALSTWDDVKAHGEDTDAFRLYLPQVQQQLYVTGADEGFLVFYNVDTKQMMEFCIKADKAMQDEIVKQGKLMWEAVQKRKEPPKDPERDIFIPKGQSAIDWVSAAESYRFFESEIKELKEKIAALQEQQKPYVDSMKKLMGEYLSGEYCGVLITRYHTQGRIDYRKIVEDKAQLSELELEQYRSEPAERCRVTVTSSIVPRNIVEPEVVKALEDTSGTIESAWF